MQPKLKDCQTRRYHNNCGRHNVQILSTDDPKFVDIPMICTIEAFIKMIDSLNFTEMFPTGRTVINCKGEAAVDATRVTTETRPDVNTSFALTVGVTLSEAAKAKDKIGYSFKFNNISTDFITMLKNRVITFDEIRNVLDELRNRLNRLE